MADLSADELLDALGVEVTPVKTSSLTPFEERVIAGFEDIQRFFEEHKRLPRNAEGLFEASCQQMDAMWLFTETFYWVAHKATSVILANHACYQGRRLPKMPAKIAHGGVTNVRNHLIEHPFEYSNSFGLGGMWCGPVLSGGLGKDSKGNEIKDPGLYLNAIEWADTISQVLSRASEELRKEAV